MSNKFRNPGKWKADGPVRVGTGFSIKKESISAPIPRIEDDEFPIRTPGASIATPIGRDSLEKQSRFTGLSIDPRRSGNDVTLPVDPARPTKTPSTNSKHTSEEPIPQPEQPAALRTSIGSVRSRTSIQKPQRKKSTLRSVFGKLFGRKRKSSTSPSRKTDSQDLRAGQHLSDPTALNRSPIPSTNSQKRSASLPINEFNRALRSHSVILEDFPLRDSYEPRDSLKAEGSFTRPRGATTPSRLWDQHKPGHMDWTGLSPRPASSHARGSKVDSGAEAREVGVALTSGSKQENRKSRSVGDLKDVMQNTITRRRSDEIRYWRQSYEHGVLSPMSSNKPDVDEEPLVVEEMAESDKENYEPPQPFNFGPMGEMAGMKITQAASLETRVMRLEDRMLKMERVISQLPFASSTEAMQFQEPHRRNKSIGRPTTGDSELSLPKHKIHRSSPQRPIRQGPGSQFRSSSYSSSRPSTQNNISSQPSFENPPPMFSTFHANGPRPLSTSTTIRNNPLSSSPTTKDGALTIEHYNTLQTLVQSEQSARHTLEDLVQNLQQEVHNLRESIAHHPAFSTFSHDGSDEEDGDERFVQEDFQTPMEQPMSTNGTRGFGDEIFGDVSGNRGLGFERGRDDVKSAPRTLSLGEITQKAQTQAGANF